MIIDAHIHLDLYPETDRTKLLEAAFGGPVAAVVAVAMDLDSSRQIRELALAYPGRIMPAYGFHPEQPVPSEAEEQALFSWIAERYAAGEQFAIGEVGLPYYMRTELAANGGQLDEQPYIGLLGRFAAFAAERQLPMALHAVYDDADKACDLLEEHGVARAHFHWFKGAPHTIERMIRNRYLISVTPDIAYEPEIQALAKLYPLDLLMVETDGPWPFEGEYAHKQTSPLFAQDAIRHIAILKGLAEHEVAEAVYRNTARFYGIQAIAAAQ